MNTADWKNATAEQLNFWRLAKGAIAWNTPPTPVFYQAIILGSEFLDYNANKMYIALELEFSLGFFGPSTTPPVVTLHGAADLTIGFLKNQAVVCNATMDEFSFLNNTVCYKNYYFSRIEVSATITYMKFNGYRLDII